MTGLHEIAVALFTALAAVLGVRALPEPPDPAWRVVRAWEPHGAGRVLEAVSTAVPEACRADPDARVDFPRVIHGAQEIRLDGLAVVRFGVPDFARSRSAMGAPSLACAEIAGARELGWTAWSSTFVFARVPFFPRLTHGPPLDAFFAEVLPLMAAGCLFGGALFCFLIFRGVASETVRLSLVAAALGFGCYCLAIVAGIAGLPLSVLGALRLANLGLLSGALALFNVLRAEGLLPRALFATYAAVAVASVGVQAVASDGDVAHLGTFLTVPFVVALLAVACGAAIRSVVARGVSMGGALQITSLVFLGIVLANDVLVFRGKLTGPLLGPLATLGGVMFFTLAVQRRILDTFRERDFLRGHLEAEVERQTAESHRRAQALGQSLDDLRRAQAQLVHSEKMASLGVVVAGVAHELNNPVSFIANNAEPLATLVQEARDAAARGDVRTVAPALERIARVVEVMRRGAERTATIVADLRSFSRRGTGEAVVVDVHEGIEVSLRLLHARWADRIEIVRDFGPPLRLRAPCGELNQVFMNLLTNACDAIAGTGHVWIRTAVEGGRVVIAVRDDGAGIAPDDVPRIFDPFFSTKDPGKGTGLGLAVSHGVVARLGGDILVATAPGAGTTMTVRLPASLLVTGEAARAEPAPSAREAGPVVRANVR